MLLADGQFHVAPDAARGRHSRTGRYSSRRSSRRLSRRSSQQHDVSRDVDVSVTPYVTECDGNIVAAADATSTADDGLYSLDFAKFLLFSSTFATCCVKI